MTFYNSYLKIQEQYPQTRNFRKVHTELYAVAAGKAICEAKT